MIADDRRRQAEAAHPKIDIHLERLEHIREDALKTRDSLLTEEEMEEALTESVRDESSPGKTPPPADTGASSQARMPIEAQILTLLLRGESPDELMKARRLMPSVVADAINEAYFDEIGDNIVECEGDRLALVEDYAEEIEQILNKAL